MTEREEYCDDGSIEVKPKYVRYASDQARKRNKAFKQRESYQNRLEREERHPEMDNLIGLVGEIAFAKYADIQIDAEIYDSGDEGVDFYISIGGEEYTVDMKTRAEDPFAFWVKEKTIRSDYYVLGKLSAPIDFDSQNIEDLNTYAGWEVELLGKATKEQLLDAKRIESDMGWMNRSIPLDDLDPVPIPEHITLLDPSEGR